ncbi:hypothetical protein [Glaciibacter flavus]|uniref:hypothetical protein n=1 Tax=Orlajensenia flava TaxID=2565934 RepID=UPI003B00A4BE
MRTVSLVLRRSRARAALLAVCALVVLLGAAGSTVIAGGLLARAEAGVVSVLGANDDSTRFDVVAAGVDPDDDRARVGAIIEKALAPLGPLATRVDETSAEAGGDPSTVARSVRPSAQALSMHGATALSERLDRVVASLQPDAVEGAQLTTSGGLPDLLHQIRRGMLAEWSVAPIPLALVLVFALIALVQVASLLVEARRSETALLSGRGATPVDLAALGLVEGLVVGAPAAVCGWAIGVAVAGPAALSSWPLAGVTAALCALALSVTAALAGRRTGMARRSAAPAALVIGTVLLLIVAVTTTGQLIRNGVINGDSIDLIALCSPVVLLVSGALLSVLVFRPLAGWYAAVAARRRGFSPSFGARQLARRTTVMPVAVLSIALAIGAAVFAAGYSATWTADASARADRGNGADVRVRLADLPDGSDSTSISPAEAVQRVASITGVSDAAPLSTASLRIGSDPADLVAIAGSRVTAIMSPVGGTVDPAAIGRAITTAAPGLALTPGAAVVSLDLGITAPADQARGSVIATIRLADADGALVSVPAGSLAVDSGGGSLSATVPSHTGAWRLLAIDVELRDANGASGIAASVRSASADGTPLAVPSGPVDLSSLNASGRVMAKVDGSPVPAVVSRALADSSGLKIGDPLPISFDDAVRSTTVKVAGIVAVVPGSSMDAALVADLPSLDDALLRGNDTASPTDEVWASAGDPASAATAARAAIPDAQVSIAEPNGATRLAGAAIGALWIGFAVSAVLALVSVVAVAMTLTMTRREESAVLRALGVGAREQSRSRGLELALLVVLSILLGVISGLAAVFAAAGPLARGAVVAAPLPVPLAPDVDALALTAAVLGLAVGLGVVVSGYTLAVRSGATTALVRGER